MKSNNAMWSLHTHLWRVQFKQALSEGWASSWLREQKPSTLQNLFPELYDTMELGGGSHHSETVFEHLLGALAAAERRGYPTYLRLAALLHDVGKPAACKKVIRDNGDVDYTFHKHEVLGAPISRNICKRLGYSQYADRVSLLVRHHMFHFGPETKNRTIRRWLHKVGEDNWMDLIQLRMVDREGNRALANRPVIYRQLAEFQRRVEELIQRDHDQFRCKMQMV